MPDAGNRKTIEKEKDGMDKMMKAVVLMGPTKGEDVVLADIVVPEAGPG